MAPTVLFLHNQYNGTEAMLGDAFADCGFDVATFGVVPAERVEDPDVEVAFPDPTDYDVIVPLGASWSVYEKRLLDSWVGAEMAMVRAAADAGIPTLGVCFGGQLIAQTFGGSVARAEVPEIGWYDVVSDDEELVPGGRWFEWHFDRWTVPPGATEIARTANSSQAFVLRKALALQFHPELDRALLEGWLADDPDGEVLSTGVSPDELRSATTEMEASAATRIRRLVRGFTDRIVRQP